MYILRLISISFHTYTLLQEIQFYFKYLVRNIGELYDFSENVQVYDLFIIYHTEKNVILSVENLSTLIVLKSKFKLRAQNERYETYKIKNKFLRHFLNYFEGFFLYNFKLKTKKSCDERVKIIFTRNLLVKYWTKFALRKEYQRLKIVTTNTLRF